MAGPARLAKSLSKLIFPIILLLIAAVIGASVWFAYMAARPVPSVYLVTPEKYGQISSRAAQISDETWANKDGSTARGWLLRGGDNAPAVIIFHRYGADRSHVIDLGVKLNESTNFTVLMPDLRAHGENPLVARCTFGGCEGEDAHAAVEFLRSLRTPAQLNLVGQDIGVFGIEMGGLIALDVADHDPKIRAIALDSLPADSAMLLEQVSKRRYPFLSSFTSKLAHLGSYIYFFDGCFDRVPACEKARKITNRHVLLLGGLDNQELSDSTMATGKCFPNNNRIETKFDLSPSGMSIINASLDQSQSYDQRIIDFFRSSLAN